MRKSKPRHRATIDRRPKAILSRMRIRRYYLLNQWHYFKKPKLKARTGAVLRAIRAFITKR